MISEFQSTPHACGSRGDSDTSLEEHGTVVSPLHFLNGGFTDGDGGFDEGNHVFESCGRFRLMKKKR